VLKRTNIIFQNRTKHVVPVKRRGRGYLELETHGENK